MSDEEPPEELEITGEEFHRMIQPHIDALSVVMQQAGGGDGLTIGEYRLAMEHAAALTGILTNLCRGPARSIASLIESYLQLAQNFNFH